MMIANMDPYLDKSTATIPDTTTKTNDIVQHEPLARNEHNISI